MKDVVIVSATRMIKQEFEKSSPLGQSLKQLAFDTRVVSSIVYANADGLGTVYNRFLTPAYADKIVLLVHDDVYIGDCFVRYRLNEALDNFDVVGLAGNKAPDFRQPSWGLKCNELGQLDGSWQDDMKNLSGAVAHQTAEGEVGLSVYGEMPARCELMDGLFLAVNTEKLLQANVTFDPPRMAIWEGSRPWSKTILI